MEKDLLINKFLMDICQEDHEVEDHEEEEVILEVVHRTTDMDGEDVTATNQVVQYAIVAFVLSSLDLSH